MSSSLVSIVVPMYFEELVVEECYKRLTAIAHKNKLNYELIFVNDGSRDRTLELLEIIALQDCRVKVINLSRNFGHQVAVTAGIDNSSGDCIIIIDADLQDPPELIPDMIKLWQEGNEVVYGKRKSREGEGLFKLLTAKIYYRLLSMMCSIKMPLDTGDFRLLDRKVVEVLKRMPEHNRFLRGMSSWAGFKQIPIEYERKERFAGKTKYPLKKMLKLAFDGIVSFSNKPLKLIEYTGVIVTLISFVLLIYCLIAFTGSSNNLTMGWMLALNGVVMIGGIQILAIGVVGEYISRIYDESKGRPLYIIERKLNFGSNRVHSTDLIARRISFKRDLIKPIKIIDEKLMEENKYGIK